MRENSGHKDLLSFEGDNTTGDSSLNVSAFPSLLQNVVPYRENTHLPRFEITEDDYSYITTHSGLESYALGIQSHVQSVIDTAGTIRVGLDTEFDHDGVHLLTLNFEGYCPTCLIHL